MRVSVVSDPVDKCRLLQEVDLLSATHPLEIPGQERGIPHKNRGIDRSWSTSPPMPLSARCGLLRRALTKYLMGLLGERRQDNP